MLNIILVASTQERARRLVRELWENNQDICLKGGYPTIIGNDDFKISAFSKYSAETIRGLHADQLFIEENMKLTRTEAFYIFDTLKYSCVPEKFHVVRLSEDY